MSAGRLTLLLLPFISLLLFAVFLETRSFSLVAPYMMDRWEAVFTSIFIHNASSSLCAAAVFRYVAMVIEALPEGIRRREEMFLRRHSRGMAAAVTLILIFSSLMKASGSFTPSLALLAAPIAFIEAAGIFLSVHSGLTCRLDAERIACIYGIFLSGAAAETAVIFLALH